jgi:phage terminase large subunit
MVNAAPNNALAEASSSTVPSDKVALTNCFLGLRVEYTGIFGKEAADALIDQEYYCSFEAAILGAYWGKEMLLAEQQGRICDVPVNIGLPVHTAWDIGVDDAMAIWCFQVYPDHLDIVDYYEGHGQGFDHYCEWLDKRGYHGTDCGIRTT